MRTNSQHARSREIAYDIILVLYCKYDTGILLDYSNMYAWYHITCMREYGYGTVYQRTINTNNIYLLTVLLTHPLDASYAITQQHIIY